VLVASEKFLVTVNAFRFIIMNSLFVPSAPLFILLAVSGYSMLWTNLYFRPASPKLVPA